MPKHISVIIPTIEEESVFTLIHRIRQMFGSGVEIIIVDKSSEAYRKRLEKTGAIVIRQRSRGVENAIVEGLRAAHGDILASIDADGTHDPEGLKEGVRIIEKGDVGLVLGNRLAGLEKGSMSFYLRFGNRALSYIFSKLYRTKVHDVLTGLFVMRRDAFDEIRKVDPYRAGIAFFAIELARRGWAIDEVGIRYYKRAYGKSKLTSSKFAYGINVGAHLIRQIRDYSPLMVFGGIGGAMAVIGVVLGLFVVFNFANTGVLSEPGRALLSIMLIIAGIFLVVSGLILDLLIGIERMLQKRD